jgi:hypothetical protein
VGLHARGGSAKWGCTSLPQPGRACRYTEHGAADGGRDGQKQRIYCMDRRARERKGTDNRSKCMDNRIKGKDKRSKGTDNRSKGTGSRSKGTGMVYCMDRRACERRSGSGW